MLAGNRDYVSKHPTATKRVLRAILKAADLCVSDPQRVARQLVDSGFTDRYDYALQALADLPYDKWREYDPEDTVRFYALRLHEAGMIKSTPQKIIASPKRSAAAIQTSSYSICWDRTTSLISRNGTDSRTCRN